MVQVCVYCQYCMVDLEGGGKCLGEFVVDDVDVVVGDDVGEYYEFIIVNVGDGICMLQICFQLFVDLQ